MQIAEQYDSTQDRFEAAAQWALAQPNLRQMMRDCYVTLDTIGDARRFSTSAEFADTLGILAELGRGPGHSFKLLDFGCGNGMASYSFTRAGYSVTATDLCNGQVAGLQAASRLVGLDGCTFRILSGHWSPENDDTEYDVIYCRQVLHHLDDLRTGLLPALVRRLRPGGVFCAVREQVIWSEQQRQRLKEEHPLNQITQDEDGYYVHEYQAALNDGGLRLVKTLWPLDSVINTFPQPQYEAHLRVWQHLPAVGKLLHAAVHRVPRIEHPVLRAVTHLRRHRPAWHVFSFFAVKGSSPRP